MNPENRIIQSDSELHCALDVPRHTSKQIHNWVQEQEWPEGTSLEHPTEYHVTIMYSPEGHDQHKDSWWLEHLEHAEAKVNSIAAFPAQEKGYAYVLKLDAPEVKEHADIIQNRAEAMGLPITHFDGGYKPHITVAYGPSSSLAGIKAPDFSFDIGPSSVSSPRPKESKLAGPPIKPPNYRHGTTEEHCGNCKMFWKGKCGGYWNEPVKEDATCDSWTPEVKRSNFQYIRYTADYNPDSEPITLEHIAHLMENECGFGSNLTRMVWRTQGMLKAAGYPDDEVTLQAAFQTWYLLYPEGLSPSEKFAGHSGDLSQTLSQTRIEDTGPEQGDSDAILDKSGAAAPLDPAALTKPRFTGIDSGRHWGVVIPDESAHGFEGVGSSVDVPFAPRHSSNAVGTRVDGAPPVSIIDTSRAALSLERGIATKGMAPAKMADRSIGIEEDDKAIHHWDPIIAAWEDEYEPEDWEMPEFHPWQRGTEGKGLINRQGQLLTWGINDYGDPHHDDVSSQQNYPYAAKVNIHPSGAAYIPSPDALHLFGMPRAEAEQHLWREAPQQGLRFNPGFTAATHTQCLNCGGPLEDETLPACPHCGSTVPSQVNNPDDHWPEYGEVPPDHHHEIEFSNDWNWH